MHLTFLGTTSQGGNCPSAFATDRDTLVVQGWRVTDEGALAALKERGLPDYETAVEIPKGLLHYFEAQT